MLIIYLFIYFSITSVITFLGPNLYWLCNNGIYLQDGSMLGKKQKQTLRHFQDKVTLYLLKKKSYANIGRPVEYLQPINHRNLHGK